MGAQYDGLLGDREDPIMQDWVHLDNKISERLYCNGFAHEGRVKELRENYDNIRKSMFEKIASLNDTMLFKNDQKYGSVLNR